MTNPQVVVPPEGEVDLRAYLRVLRRRWKLVAAVAVAVVAAVAAITLLQAPTYRASAEILMRQLAADSYARTGDATSPADAARRLENEVRLLESGVVVDAVEEAYDGPLDPGEVRGEIDSDSSDVVLVTHTGTDADESVELVDVYVATFLDVRRELRSEELLASAGEIQSKITELSTEIDETRAPLAELDAQVVANPDDPALVQQRNALESRLTPELNALSDQRSYFEEQLQDLEITSQIADASGATVLTPAGTPDGQVGPKTARNLALGAMLGLVLGVAAAFVAESLDDRLRDPSDLEHVRHGLLTLAMIPAAGRRRDASFVAVRDDPHGPEAEAFRQLRTAVEFAGRGQQPKVIQVTSPAQGEGKTTVVANLAVALARGGDQVAVVDGDFRSPRVHECFHQPLSPGFSDVILDDAELGQAVTKTDPRTLVLTAGSARSNPSELLGSARATEVVEALAKRFDVVLVDSTPTLPVADALLISQIADATLVVADARSTHGGAMKRTLQLLDQAHARVLGVVLNRAPSEGDAYGYGVPVRTRATDAADRDSTGTDTPVTDTIVGVGHVDPMEG